jgi:hypothetical protein
MKTFPAHERSSVCYGLAILVVVLCAFAAMPLLSRAQTQAASIRVDNNSNWVIRHIYLSSVTDNNWGPDQLNDSVLNPGSSFTISTVCDGSQIKVISEDVDGCFLAKVVDCSDNAVWIIGNNATRNCGGE